MQKRPTHRVQDATLLSPGPQVVVACPLQSFCHKFIAVSADLLLAGGAYTAGGLHSFELNAV